MADLTFLYAAYTIVWVSLFLYMLKIHLDQMQLSREMEMLKEVSIGRKRRK